MMSKKILSLEAAIAEVCTQELIDEVKDNDELISGCEIAIKSKFFCENIFVNESYKNETGIEKTVSKSNKNHVEVYEKFKINSKVILYYDDEHTGDYITKISCECNEEVILRLPTESEQEFIKRAIKYFRVDGANLTLHLYK